MTKYQYQVEFEISQERNEIFEMPKGCDIFTMRHENQIEEEKQDHETLSELRSA